MSRRWLDVLGAGVVAMGLSAWFWIPLILERAFIASTNLASGYYDFRFHFAAFWQVLWSKWGYGISEAGAVRDGLSFSPGVVSWGGIALALLAVLQRRKLFSSWFALALFFAALLAFWFMTPASQAAWERIWFFQFIQYPWRWLGVLSLASAWLLVWGAQWASTQLEGWVFGTDEVSSSMAWEYGVVVVLLFGVFWQSWQPRQPGFFLEPEKLSLTALRESEKARLATASAELLFPSDYQFGIEKGYFAAGTQELVPLRTNEPILLSGAAEFTTLQHDVNGGEWRVVVTQTAQVQLPFRRFPGWSVLVNGKQYALASQKNADNAESPFLTVSVPPGISLIRVRWQGTALERASERFSLVVFVAFIAGWTFWLLGGWSRWYRTQPEAASH